jgi:hypothetical protein
LFPSFVGFVIKNKFYKKPFNIDYLITSQHRTTFEKLTFFHLSLFFQIVKEQYQVLMLGIIGFFVSPVNRLN